MKRIITALFTFVCISCLVTGCTSAPAATSGANTPQSTSAQTAQTTGTPEISSSPAADESWDYIQQKGTLIVGLDDTFAPMGFRDANGNLVGFDIDVANAAAKYLNIKIQFQPIDWSAKEMELSTKKIDCIWNGLSATAERKQNLTLSQAYLNNRTIIMTVDGVTVNSKEDLKGLKIGTQAKSSALEALMNDPIYADVKENVSEYQTFDECIMDMQAGRIQAMIVDEVLGEYKNSTLEKKFNVSTVDFGNELYVVGFRKGDEALADKINEALNALIADGTTAEISTKWFGKDIVLK